MLATSMPIQIGRHLVGSDQPLFVIAELGLNHGGSVDHALRLVDHAAAAGASAVKLQTIAADRLVSPSAPAPTHVQASSLRDFFRAFELDASAHRAVATRARSHGLAFISTPFYEEAVDLLLDVGVDAIKIASGDITHSRLIERAAATGKPLIISTGMSTAADVADAVDVARAGGSRALALLHCVSSYPVPEGRDNLRAMSTLAALFGVPIGLSDHSANPLAAPLTVALGGSLFEKHLVEARGGQEVDAAVSAIPVELAAIVASAAATHRALGDGRKVCLDIEADHVVPSRRSLVAARDLRPGHRIESRDLLALRPATGLDARRWRGLLGRRVTRVIPAGEPFIERDLEGLRGEAFRDVA